MAGLRARLSWFTALWLVCQATSLAMAPFALCCREDAMLVAGLAAESGGGDEAEASCPLHTGVTADLAAPALGTDSPTDLRPAPATDPHSGNGGCVIGSTCMPSDPVLMSLLGALAVLPETAATNALTVSPVVHQVPPAVRSLPSLPDAPPPRV